MSMTAPSIVVKSGGDSIGNSASQSSSTMLSIGPSREMTGNRLFQFYMESFFKIPKDIKNDIIYCQRALKAHIKVHQMVLDVFQQQPDADPQQKKRILDELETEIYEINAEQSFLFLRLRRIIDEFYKMLKKNGIPTDTNATNAIVSKEIVPYISDTTIEIIPVAVMQRLTEEKLIEKYFEVQKEQSMEMHSQPMEIIDLDDDGGSVVEKITKSQQSKRSLQKREYCSSTTYNAANGESLLRNYQGGISQTSLLKPMNQRVANDLDVKPKVGRPSNQSYAQQHQQAIKEEEAADKDIVEMPVSTNVRMSRMNLRQALKRAQAAVRGPIIVPPAPPLPPPVVLQPPVVAPIQPPVKISAAKARATRAAAAAATAAAAAALAANKSPENTSSSGEGTPERGATPPHAFWPDELEETRTKAEEYGQEMFLRMFDLFTPEVHAQMQQRRSKRRRRCVQNQNYHYGASTSSSNEPEAKKKRKAFLLSPQVKKALPNKRNKRRSADNASESNSVPPSRSASSSPDDKRACNECFKGGYVLELCETCKQHYHPQCHREEDGEDPQEMGRQILNESKICPACKRNNDKLLKKEIKINKKLHETAKELQMKISKEKERREILQRTGKSYKIQMNNLFKIVNALKAEEAKTKSNNSNATNASESTAIASNNIITNNTSTTTNKTTSTTSTIINKTSANDYIIHLD